MSKAAIAPILGRLRNDISELEAIGGDTVQLDQTSKQVIFIPESKNMCACNTICARSSFQRLGKRRRDVARACRQRSFSPHHVSVVAIADHADKMAITSDVLKQLVGEDHRARRIGTQRQLVALRKVESQLSKLY